MLLANMFRVLPVRFQTDALPGNQLEYGFHRFHFAGGSKTLPGAATCTVPTCLLISLVSRARAALVLPPVAAAIPFGPGR